MKKIIILLFIINSLYGVIINGINWQDEPDNINLTMYFAQAKKYCNKHNGRLPTISELRNLQYNRSRLKYVSKYSYISKNGDFVNVQTGMISDTPYMTNVKCILGDTMIKHNNGDVEQIEVINGKARSSIIPHKILKGYLIEDLTISFEEYDDILYKDSFIQINLSNNTIEIPKGYKYKVLKNIPKLYVPVDKREIDINSSIKKIHNKEFISFTIKTNVKIKEINYDNKKLTILNHEDYLYKTKLIRKKHQAALKIMLDDGSEIIYNCIDKICKEKVKLDI